MGSANLITAVFRLESPLPGGLRDGLPACAEPQELVLFAAQRHGGVGHGEGQNGALSPGPKLAGGTDLSPEPGSAAVNSAMGPRPLTWFLGEL